MRRKQKTEKQKEADNKGKERMKRFEENQKAPKEKVESPKADMACVEYWEKNVVAGDHEWVKRMYFYNKKDKRERFSI